MSQRSHTHFSSQNVCVWRRAELKFDCGETICSETQISNGAAGVPLEAPNFSVSVSEGRSA